MPRTLHQISPLLLAISLVAAAALVPVAAQAETMVSSGLGPMIKGSGKVVDQARSIGSFSRLRLEGSFTVKAQQGSAMQLSVRADDNLTDMIETVVVGDTLVVRGKPKVSWRTSSPMQVNVTFMQLQSAELSGSGDLNIRDLQAERFSADVSGSGDMRIERAQLMNLQAKLAGSGDIQVNGSAQTVDAKLAGSGDIDLSKLQARQATVNLSGSGDVNVYATEKADVALAGTGDVRVYGKPGTVNRRVVGTGDIHLK